MSIATEITRLQGAKANIKTAIENKGVTVPSSALISDYDTYIGQISGGGNLQNKTVNISQNGTQTVTCDSGYDGLNEVEVITAVPENLFLQEQNLKYMFDYRNSSDDKVMDGITRFSRNTFTDLNHAFFHFNDDRVTTVPLEKDLCLSIIKTMISNSSSVDKQYMLSNYSVPLDTSLTYVLDLSDLNMQGNCNNMLEYAGPIVSSSQTQYMHIFKTIINSDTFLNASRHDSLFYNYKGDIQFKDANKIKIKKDATYIFDSKYATLIDSNGNQITDFTIEIDPNVTSNIKINRAFYSYNKLERLNIINGNKVSGYDYIVYGCTNLKSLTGLSLNNVDATSINPFAYSSSNHYPNFGELGIVNGSNIGSYNGIRNFRINRIWEGTTSDIKDGQTIGYWYEKFANALGNKYAQSTSAHTITINTTLYNSLTQAQKELITDKGYVLASTT